jgi:alpha-tubulin suppressor-like RCC1 family protein
VHVTDRFGNVLSGVTVTWTVASGGGSASVPSSTTDASGRASAEWTVGTAGSNSLTASVPGVTSLSFFAQAFGPASPVGSSASAGHRHTCAISQGGVTYCWGANENGQLGDGTTTTRSTPAVVTGSIQFVAVAAGGDHACALAQDGAAYCWGLNDHGQLGDGTTTTRLVATAVAGPVRFVALTLGHRHTCGLTSIGSAYCWGSNADGQLGDGTGEDRLAPTRVSGELLFQTLTTGFWFTCGLSGSSIYCWGKNDIGQLGDGTNTHRVTPTRIVSGQAFSTVEAGGSHGCGLAAGAAFCWGGGPFGALGGSDAAAGIPVSVEGNAAFASISAGDSFTCGLTTTGLVYCWGINHVGELGRGTTNTTDNPTPVAVSGGLQFASHVAGIGRYSCGRATPSSGLYCWGMNFDGQLGDGTTTHRSVPWPVVIP